VESQVYIVLPQEAQEWARQQGWPEPPAAPASGAQDSRLQLVMTRPDPGSIYQLSPNLPLWAQQIEVSARPAGDALIAELTLYVDERPLQSFRVPPYRAFWALEPGEHSFVARGQAVDGSRLESEAVWVLVREE
jgi:hypothetical protein